MKIHKETLRIKDVQNLDLPDGAQIISVQEQYGILTLWYSFDDEKYDETGRTETVVIHIIGTGNPFEAGQRRHLGTVIMPNGLVWHIFEALSQF